MQEAANRADRYAYRDRRNRKRQYRRLWIQRIGAAARLNGLSYSQLMHGLKSLGLDIDRKMLADLAVKDAAGFAQIAASEGHRRNRGTSRSPRQGLTVGARCAKSSAQHLDGVTPRERLTFPPADSDHALTNADEPAQTLADAGCFRRRRRRAPI